MEYTGSEPRLSAYLHAKACAGGIPLAGTFELTARCNLNCKMCYVRLSAQEQQARGRELTADEWLAIAEQARSQGMLFLLLTGGEPLIRPDFRHILTELKKMGILVSVNSNASLIDDDWLEFFKKEPPFRFNITLYGGSAETYERLCGRPVYDRVAGSIRALREIGVGVKLNASITPYNRDDMRAIYDFAREQGIPMQLTTYMFPPIRRDESLAGGGDRFTAEDAARYAVEWDRIRLSPEEFRLRAGRICRGDFPADCDACDGTPGEGVMCRAGRHDELSRRVRAGAGFFRGVGADEGGCRCDKAARRVLILRAQGALPPVRGDVRNGDGRVRQASGVSLPDGAGDRAADAGKSALIEFVYQCAFYYSYFE